MCIRGIHPFNAGPRLPRDSGIGMVVEVVTRGARHIHPGQAHFRVAGLRAEFGRCRQLSGDLGFLGLMGFDRGVLHDPAVAAIHHIHKPFAVHGNTIGEVELPLRPPAISPLTDKDAVARELLDTMIVRVHDIDVPQGIDRDAPWRAELAGPLAFPAPLGQKIAAAIELLNAIVDLVGHINVADEVHRDVTAIKERAVERALFPPH